eukprot:TRINITY_DN1610_c0_g4_i2.p1 TRINITY_DN1610_c0_g4~~TRINITY_DN1610_c0_g4_i2.p1  ORF type:complete len:118 (-),score=13.01 TRINITY_DN1610_c0_g4_i2:596-949(-)
MADIVVAPFVSGALHAQITVPVQDLTRFACAGKVDFVLLARFLREKLRHPLFRAMGPLAAAYQFKAGTCYTASDLANYEVQLDPSATGQSLLQLQTSDAAPLYILRNDSIPNGMYFS